MQQETPFFRVGPSNTLMFFHTPINTYTKYNAVRGSLRKSHTTAPPPLAPSFATPLCHLLRHHDKL